MEEGREGRGGVGLVSSRVSVLLCVELRSCGGCAGIDEPKALKFLSLGGVCVLERDEQSGENKRREGKVDSGELERREGGR